MPTLTLVRGLPGSGKSTLARRIAAGSTCTVHVEADMFMVDDNGDYAFDPAKLSEAHNKCQDTARRALLRQNDVIVSNTFTCMWELKPYFELAYSAGLQIPTVIVCENQFESIHGVPDEAMARMRARWEPLDLDSLIRDVADI